jgi:amino-acid N-acetyltransferase
MIRRARAEDAPAIHALIHRYAGQDLLLPRPLADIYDRIRDFWVATDRHGSVVGCVAMRIWWHDLAEVRSLAVDTGASGRGYGGRLVEAVAQEASRYGVKVLFALTRVEPWFVAHGFTAVDRGVLYQKVWGDCARCPFVTRATRSPSSGPSSRGPSTGAGARSEALARVATSCPAHQACPTSRRGGVCASHQAGRAS